MTALNQEVKAIQNPALGSMLLWRSVSSYQTSHQTASSMPLPACFLILPMLFHEQTAEVISATQTASGLRKFTEKFRSSELSQTDILLSIDLRARHMRQLTWESLRLAFSSHLLSLDVKEGVVGSLTDTSPTVGIPLSVRRMFKNADKIGAWFSSLTLYELGLQIQVAF